MSLLKSHISKIVIIKGPKLPLAYNLNYLEDTFVI